MVWRRNLLVVLYWVLYRDGGFQDSFQQFDGRTSLLSKWTITLKIPQCLKKGSILKAFNSAVEEIIKPLNEEISPLQSEVKKLIP